MKRKSLFLLPLLASSILPVSLATVSCSSGSDSNPDNSNDKNLIAQAIENEKIRLDYLSISKDVFDQNKSNLDEISKLVYIGSNTSEFQNLKFEMTSSPSYDDASKTLSYSYKITNLDNPQETYTSSNKVTYNFISNAEYMNRSLDLFVSNNVRIKQEYANERVINLFKQTSTNQEFINKYVNKEFFTSKLIGIKIDWNIPTQTTAGFNGNIFMKVDINISFGNSSSSASIYLKVENDNLRDTFTIFNSSDLSKTNDELNLSGNSFGQLLFRTDQNLPYQQQINFDFSNKGIIGTVDFSGFNNIIFGDNVSFRSNYINNVIFNPASSINKLNSNMFITNVISSVILPERIEVMGSDVFDYNVDVKSVNSIEFWKKYYNEKTKDLNLSNVQDRSELITILSILSTVNLRNRIEFNKVSLPFNFCSYSINKNIRCNEIVIVGEHATSFEFSMSWLSNWTYTKISIPKSVTYLRNINSSKTINRQIKEEIRNYVSSNSSLLITKDNKDLWNNLNDLDSLFYGSGISINEIIFDCDGLDVSLSSYSLYWNCFKESRGSKKITIKSNVQYINEYTFNTIANFSETNKITFERQRFLDTTVINNNTLYLGKFYEAIKNSTHISISDYLWGYENLITSIDTTGIDTIKSKTFYNVKWSAVSINLDPNVVNIEDEAFCNSSFQEFNITNHKFKSVGKKAFYYSSWLSGNLDLTNVTKLDSYSFYGTRITNVILSSSLKIIPDYAFGSCSKLVSIDLSNVENIGSGSFSGCYELNNIDSISNVIKIGSNAFSNCSNLTGPFTLNSNVVIGSNAFQNCSKLTSLNNLNLSNSSLLSVFGNMKFENNVVSNNYTDEQINNQINYNPSTKVLNLSQFDFDNIEKRNLLVLFIKRNPKLILNELIVPDARTINTEFKNIFDYYVDVTIKKLTWNSLGSKEIGEYSKLSSYFNNAKIEKLNDDFFSGVRVIPKDFIDSKYSNLQNTQFNFNTVEIIGENAFSSVKNPIKFINTNMIKQIKSKAFNSNCEFNIPTDVKLEEDSFTELGVINNPDYKIKRERIFSNLFAKVYNERTKILDYSKIQNDSELNKYIDNPIHQYLLDGDVNKIILPNTIFIKEGIVNKLGQVQEIQFQYKNNVIDPGTFNGTQINTKPSIENTHIVVDLDHFFE